MSIQSFGNSITEKIFLGVKDKEVSRFPQDILRVAERKLDMLEAAVVIQDLASPPANRLEKLKGNLKDFLVYRHLKEIWRIVTICRILYGDLK